MRAQHRLRGLVLNIAYARDQEVWVTFATVPVNEEGFLLARLSGLIGTTPDGYNLRFADSGDTYRLSATTWAPTPSSAARSAWRWPAGMR